MNRFLHWLGSKLFGKKEAAEQSLHQTGTRLPRARKVGRHAPPAAPVVEFDPTIAGAIEDGGVGKNVLIRNRIVREDTGTHDTLKILDDSLLESDDEVGIDPYNTGQFDRSKSWTSLNRK